MRYFQKLISISTGLLIALSLTSCGAGEVVPSQEVQSSQEILIPDHELYATFDYGSWDKNEIYKFMSNRCKDALETYGLMKQFIDATKLAGYPSAVIFNYCIRDGSGAGIEINFIERDNQNKIFISHKLLTEGDKFNFEEAKLEVDVIKVTVTGFSSEDVPNCCRDVTDEAQIYFDGRTPNIKFLTKNDYRLNELNK